MSSNNILSTRPLNAYSATNGVKDTLPVLTKAQVNDLSVAIGTDYTAFYVKIAPFIAAVRVCINSSMQVNDLWFELKASSITGVLALLRELPITNEHTLSWEVWIAPSATDSDPNTNDWSISAADVSKPTPEHLETLLGYAAIALSRAIKGGMPCGVAITLL